MKTIHLRKTRGKNIKKILMMFLLPVFFYGAAKLGIIGGNYLYSLDSGIISKVDVSYFESIINSSLPIITTVYDSGNVGGSFTAGIKNMINGIFNLDLDNPVSIFNAQSPLFYTYYNNKYLKDQLAQNDTVTPIPDGSGITPTPAAQTPGTGETRNNGSGENSSGNNAGNTTGNTTGNTSNDPGINPGSSQGSNTGSDQGNNQGNSQGSNNGTGNNTGNGTGNATGLDSLEPASSIAFDEEEEGKSGTGKVESHGKLFVQNNTSNKIDIEKLLSEPFSITFSKKGPQILIYHTHTKESYVLKASDLGKRNVPIYNTDPLYSVVRVGDELSKNLKKYGLNVLHNGTVHDTNHQAAYGASLKTLQEYKNSYPSLNIYFDLHRDGLSPDKPKLRITTTIDKKTVAQVMFVIGAGSDSLPNPKWKENLKFALHIQQKLNEKYPGLARPIYISKSRYNQHISTDSLIIEIGGDGNLLSECIESTKYIAWAVNEVINGK